MQQIYFLKKSRQGRGERLINARITNLANQSGSNTGDRDLGALATTAKLLQH
jgi:hypothetical protein